MESVRGNVLVVEDDPDCGDTILQFLAKSGFGVRLTRSRDEAASALTHYLYDFIILDVAMPGMSIEDFLKLAAARRAKSILVSAIVDVRAAAERLGADGWLRKPFDREQLMETLRVLSTPRMLLSQPGAAGTVSNTPPGKRPATASHAAVH
jgi:DNA-binding response OmpR family regulator